VGMDRKEINTAKKQALGIFFEILSIAKRIRKSDEKLKNYNELDLILYALRKLETEAQK